MGQTRAYYKPRIHNSNLVIPCSRRVRVKRGNTNGIVKPDGVLNVTVWFSGFPLQLVRSRPILGPVPSIRLYRTTRWELIYTIFDFIGPLHWVPVTTDRIARLSLIVDRGLWGWYQSCIDWRFHAELRVPPPLVTVSQAFELTTTWCFRLP